MADKENLYIGSDPSTLTTQQLLREINSLEKLLTQRIDSIDKAVGVAHSDLVRVPTDVDKAVSNLRAIVFSEIGYLKEKLLAIEQVRIEQKEDRSILVDSILKAAKESVAQQNLSNSTAIAKSEASTAKQIDQLEILIASTNKASDEKISDMKERMTRIEGTVSGFQGLWAEVQNLKTGSSTLLGKGLGVKDTAGWIVAGLSILWILYQAYLKSK